MRQRALAGLVEGMAWKSMSSRFKRSLLKRLKAWADLPPLKQIWIRLEQGSEIIALLILYGGVEAAGALAGADGVPEGDVVAQEHPEPFGIGGGQCFAEQCGHHGPEAVLGMGVVLLFLQRFDAGHGAEDQGVAGVVNARRKADTEHRGQSFLIDWRRRP